MQFGSKYTLVFNYKMFIILFVTIFSFLASCDLKKDDKSQYSIVEEGTLVLMDEKEFDIMTEDDIILIISDGDLSRIKRMPIEYLLGFRSIKNQNALAFAAKIGDLKIAEYFVSIGMDVNHVSDFGFTPTILAATNANPKLLKLLLSQGGSLDMKSNGEYVVYRKIVENLVWHVENEHENWVRNITPQIIQDYDDTLLLIKEQGILPTDSEAGRSLKEIFRENNLCDLGFSSEVLERFNLS